MTEKSASAEYWFISNKITIFTREVFLRIAESQAVNSIHKFKVEGIRGEDIDFAIFQGKKIIVVKAASECGHTPQYRQLQELYEEFPDKAVCFT